VKPSADRAANGRDHPSARATFFFVLWEDPLVCVISAGGSLASGLALALDYANGRPCHVLARPSWDLAIIGDALASASRWLREVHPRVRLTAMAPTAAGADHVARSGVAAIHAHNSAFISERIFYPEPDTPKLFDAVHNAQALPFKRHELAYGVPNLALITYLGQQATGSLAELVAGYRDLRFANYSARDGFRSLDGGEVRHVVNQARCGLVLSELEGPNNASMEYFLCGAPLVTTPSRGGREAMYDPRHVAIVDADPKAVEAAVRAFCSAAPDPGEIRAAALEKARPHRRRLIAWLSRIVGQDLLGQADEHLWLPQFCDKLRQTWRVERGPDGRLEARRIERWADWPEPDGPSAARFSRPGGWIEMARAAGSVARNWRRRGRRPGRS
jgi:hypothetical protein